MPTESGSHDVNSSLNSIVEEGAARVTAVGLLSQRSSTHQFSLVDKFAAPELGVSAEALVSASLDPSIDQLFPKLAALANGEPCMVAVGRMSWTQIVVWEAGIILSADYYARARLIVGGVEPKKVRAAFARHKVGKKSITGLPQPMPIRKFHDLMLAVAAVFDTEPVVCFNGADPNLPGLHQMLLPPSARGQHDLWRSQVGTAERIVVFGLDPAFPRAEWLTREEFLDRVNDPTA